jgi:hypothetical protein
MQGPIEEPLILLQDTISLARNVCGDDYIGAVTNPAVLVDCEVQQGHHGPVVTVATQG